jgi:glutamyl-tRNA synthetase
MDFYRAALDRLRAGNFVYPCRCSRGDIRAAVSAPHGGDDELIYPGTCRPQGDPWQATGERKGAAAAEAVVAGEPPRAANWRFRVPDGEAIVFTDGNFGPQKFVAGEDFGDFVVWRGDGVPAYQLACVVDDAGMRITEVVRGADLLASTARQLLLYRALELAPPAFFHCELLRDASGQRLAKRHDALSLRELRRRGEIPLNLRT